MDEAKPYWPDHCEHLKDGDLFVGSTIDYNGSRVDVYLHRKGLWPDKPEVCIRYGEEGHEYQSPYGDVEYFIDPARRIQDTDGVSVLYSKYHGPEIDLIRGYIERNPNWKDSFKEKMG